MNLSLIWKRFEVVKTRRQTWIKEKAQAVVVNHEKKFKLKLTRGEFNDNLVTAAESITEQYMRVKRTKASSRASTPLSNSYTRQART